MLPCLLGLSHLGKLGWPGMNRLHGKKLFRLAGIPVQEDKAPWVGRLPCLFNAFSKETYKKLGLPGKFG